MQHFKSNGKLLLTAEYLVLDGAKALAIPTTYGQSLSIETNTSKNILWQSYDEHNVLWFENTFEVRDGKIQTKQLKQSTGSKLNDSAISERLLQILNAVKTLNSKFLEGSKGYTVKTNQDFNRQWGLGTSSTLINNIAQWAEVNAYILLKETFGGSGYDIACAQHNSAITYQHSKATLPMVSNVNFNPSFSDQLYFVYLNKKQNSRDGIAKYKSYTEDLSESIVEINSITDAILHCETLGEFNALIAKHESIISKIIKQPKVKDTLFSDFSGEIKSLGAWGGDFVLATSKTNPKDYFKSKGFHTVIAYSKMIK